MAMLNGICFSAIGFGLLSLAACGSSPDDPNFDPTAGADAGGDAITGGRFDGGSDMTDGSTSLDTGSKSGPPASVAATPVASVTTVTTLAGSGTATFADGTGTGASFNGPEDVAVDGAGNVYVADLTNQRIRKVTSAGVVTTLAGSGSFTPFSEGTGAAATFFEPCGVSLDATGNVYVADNANERIRKVTAGGTVSTLAGSGTSTPFADGTGAAATFNNPFGIATDAAGNIYVGDTLDHRIRKVSAGGAVTTLAGSGTPTFAEGTGAGASFSSPSGVAVDGVGNVYVADRNNQRIRKVTSAGVVTTLAGSGTATFAEGTGAAAGFNAPFGVAVDAAGNVYVADTTNERIRRVTAGGVVTTMAGSGTAAFVDGVGAAASFSEPRGVAVDGAGNVYVADQNNHRIRKLTSVGFGQLAITWAPPSTAGSSPVVGYQASASAPGQPTQTCTTTGATLCTISLLASGVSYSVSVTATNAAGASVPSAAANATPN